MKNTLRKLGAIILAVAMCLSLMSVTAFADSAVATIGDTEYTSVAAAFSAAQDGDTIKLVADCTCGSALTVSSGELTIDLNGCTLRLSSTSAYIRVSSGATLTIEDSSEGGTGAVTSNYSQSTASIWVYGTMNLTGGTISGKIGTGQSTSRPCFTVGSTGTFNMSGGTVTGGYGGVVVNGGIFNMTDGTITGNYRGKGAGVYVSNSGTANISGGVINNNTATTEGADIFVNSGTLNLTAEASGTLSSCEDAITGWYTDYSGDRWSCDNLTAAATSEDTALIAAHGDGSEVEEEPTTTTVTVTFTSYTQSLAEYGCNYSISLWSWDEELSIKQKLLCFGESPTAEVTFDADGVILSVVIYADLSIVEQSGILYNTVDVCVSFPNNLTGEVVECDVTVVSTNETVIATERAVTGYTDNVFTHYLFDLTAVAGEEEEPETEEPAIEKVSESSIEKTADCETASAGDTVTYTLTSNISETMGNSVTYTYVDGEAVGTVESYTLTFHDSMDEGLTYTGVTSVTVGGEEIDAAYYTTSSDDDCTIDVIVDLAALYNAGIISEADMGIASVVVTLTATVDEGAVGALQNTAKVGYEDEESIDSSATVEVYGLTISKYDTADNTALEGAVFQLTDSEGTVVATATTGEDGTITITGLAAGTYTLTETQAPTGYVCSASGITVTISADNATDYIVSLAVGNAKIPSTGGMGTTMYTVGGMSILLAAAVLYLITRKERRI